MDQNLERTDWKGDDKDGTGDEGIDQILPTDLKGNTNGMIALDRTRPGNYTLTVQANTGGAPEAYAYGWVDFNQMVNLTKTNALKKQQSLKMVM